MAEGRADESYLLQYRRSFRWLKSLQVVLQSTDLRLFIPARLSSDVFH